MSTFSEAFNEADKRYYETFKEAFPTFPFRGSSEEDMIKIINECVEKKKNVYELGYLDFETKY